ncbi:uncharacterized protein LOC131166199 isoform X2 [Malania oleifera]|nr:uncharacterized protein LOC131166199 isoform X2 [Malania oleifera]
MSAMRKAKAEAKAEEKAEKELAKARVEVAHEVRLAREAEAQMELHVNKASQKAERQMAKHGAGRNRQPTDSTAAGGAAAYDNSGSTDAYNSLSSADAYDSRGSADAYNNRGSSGRYEATDEYGSPNQSFTATNYSEGGAPTADYSSPRAGRPQDNRGL